MGYSIGYDSRWERDIGYGVPAICDHPECGEEIDRGLGYVCGGEPYGGEKGCGLFFCSKHLQHRNKVHSYGGLESTQLCTRCARYSKPYKPTPDTLEWLYHKMTHPSWAEWRKEKGLCG